MGGILLAVVLSAVAIAAVLVVYVFVLRGVNSEMEGNR